MYLFIIAVESNISLIGVFLGFFTLWFQMYICSNSFHIHTGE